MLLIHFYHDVTQIYADQLSRLLCLYHTVTTIFKIVLQCYTDLEDCTSTSLWWCRSYHACSPLLLWFMQWSTLVMQLYTEIPYTAIFSWRFGTRYADFTFTVSVLYKFCQDPLLFFHSLRLLNAFLSNNRKSRSPTRLSVSGKNITVL
jgi:hypothetical protein